MKQEDVKIAIDWLVFVFSDPDQPLHLQPKQIQSFPKIFCLNDDVIIM